MKGPFSMPQWPAPDRVHALQTTRGGGVSRGPWSSLNLGEHCGDDPGAVAENRVRLAAALPAPPAWLKQVHGTGVLRHEQAAGGLLEGDAVISSRAGEVCAVLTADCLPVLFTDMTGGEVAAAHAGWRGLAAGVLEATLKAMTAAPAQILAWLGPAIGPDHYEVGDDVRDAFLHVDPDAGDAFIRSGDSWHADLFLLARQRLVRAGMSRGSVHSAGVCTACDTSRFFSYRRDGVTGRMATLIWIGRD